MKFCDVVVRDEDIVRRRQCTKHSPGDVRDQMETTMDGFFSEDRDLENVCV